MMKKQKIKAVNYLKKNNRENQFKTSIIVRQNLNQFICIVKHRKKQFLYATFIQFILKQQLNHQSLIHYQIIMGNKKINKTQVNQNHKKQVPIKSHQKKVVKIIKFKNISIDMTIFNTTTWIQLNNKFINNQGIQQICTQLPQLTYLTLCIRQYQKANNQISDIGVKLITCNLKKLRILSLNNNMVTDQGIKHLEKLKQLNILWLNKNQISINGVISCVKLQGLQYLHIDQNKLECQVLSKIESNSLKFISLNNNRIRSTEALGRICSPALEFLELKNNQIEYINSMNRWKLDQIQTIDLNMNPIYRIDYNHNLLKLKKFIITPVSELTKYTYRLLLANIKIK